MNFFKNWFSIVLICALCLFGDATAANRIEVYADSTIAEVPGYLIRMGDPTDEMNSYFVFEENGQVRFSHLRFAGEEEWIPYPQGSYLTPPLGVGVGFSWSFVPDIDQLKTATVEVFVERTVPAGNFFSASCAIRWDSDLSHMSEYMSIASNIGIVRYVYFDLGTEHVLREYLVVDGAGYFPLAVGNFWEYDTYTLSGLDVEPTLMARLVGSFPNPFNPQTTIAFELPNEQVVRLSIYDVSGRLVDVLIDNEIAAQGRNEVVWRGRDSGGRIVPTGVYFYRLVAGSYGETKRMVLIK